MSTKCSVVSNNGKDGRTDFHLYREAWADLLYLRLRDVECELNVYSDSNSCATIHIPLDIVDELIAGLESYKAYMARGVSDE